MLKFCEILEEKYIMYKAIKIAFILAMCVQMGLRAQNALVTKITGIKAMQGTLYLSIYDRESAWMYPDSAFRKEMVPVYGETGTFVIKDLPPGDYAMAIYHDMNENGSMDETEMKIPKEPFGFSNNPKGLRGPASFRQALFHFEGADTLTIDLVNNLFTPNKEKNGDKK